MGKIKMESPISLLIAIVDDKQGEMIEEYLVRHKLNAGILFNGKGTSESEIIDLFAFGVDDKDIVAVIVPVAEEDKILDDITELTGIENDKYGLTMLLPISSASSTILELFGIRV